MDAWVTHRATVPSRDLRRSCTSKERDLAHGHHQHSLLLPPLDSPWPRTAPQGAQALLDGDLPGTLEGAI
jgi:hypothetical protein